MEYGIISHTATPAPQGCLPTQYSLLLRPNTVIIIKKRKRWKNLEYTIYTWYYYCCYSSYYKVLRTWSASEGTHTRHTSPLFRDIFLSLFSVYFMYFFFFLPDDDGGVSTESRTVCNILPDVHSDTFRYSIFRTIIYREDAAGIVYNVLSIYKRSI